MADTEVKTNLTAAVAPTVSDDSSAGWSIFSPWVDVVESRVYFCANPAVGAAVWRELIGGAGLVFDGAKLGIGTTPSAQLDVTAATSVVGLNIDLDVTPGNALTITDSGSSVLFVIDGTGRVGIGTASPVRGLHVANSNVRLSDSQGIEFGINANYLIHASNGGGYLRFRTLGIDRISISSIGRVGVGTITPDRRFHVDEDSAATATVTQVARLTSTSSGTPANGIGVGLECEVETAAGNNEVGATIETTCTDVTATSEDFAMSFLQMVAGSTTLVESLRLEGNRLGFYGATTVVQPTALTSQDTSITHTAPGTPDFAIQNLIDSGVGSAFGFATRDEGNTVLQVILNLQTRIAELETKLQALGLLA